MKKIVRTLIIVTLIGFLCGTVRLVQDKVFLHDQLIRLHVVADSNSPADQNVKLQVKDAIVTFLQNNMPQEASVENAKHYLKAHIKDLEALANDTLAACGSDVSASVSLGEEVFPLREYDTFTLPAGVYESLRITIGAGEGRNWWCVVFPSLCTGVSEEEYREIAVSAGMTETLVSTTSQSEGYEIHFFFLDCLGKLENFFHFR